MSESYKVMVRLILDSNHSGVLGAMSKEMLGIHGSVEKLTEKFKGLKQVLQGGLMIGAGVELLRGMDDLVEKGNKLVKIQQDMAQAGATQLQVQIAYAKAVEETAKYKNLSMVDIMKGQNDARGIFGSQDAATSEVDPFLNALSFLKAFQGNEKGAGSYGALMSEFDAALKSAEIAGKITPAEATKHVDELVAMKVAFGDQLKIGQYLTAQRTGGVAMRNTDDSFRYGMFPALVQENGQNAGTMLMTAFSKIVAGVRNSTDALQEMNRIGLLDKDQLKYDKAGRVIGLKDADAMAGSRDAAMNFGSWVMTTLKPKLDAVTHGDPIREAQEISKMFPDRNAAKAITEILQQYTKLQKDSALILEAYKKIQNGGAQNYVNNSLDGQKQAFGSQLENLLALLGQPLVPKATAALRSINDVMSGLSGWAAINPAKMKAIAVSLTEIGLALVGFGAVKVGQGAWSLLSGSGLSAAATALTGSAAALDSAAVALGGKSGLGGMPGVSPISPKASGKFGLTEMMLYYLGSELLGNGLDAIQGPLSPAAKAYGDRSLTEQVKQLWTDFGGKSAKPLMQPEAASAMFKGFSAANKATLQADVQTTNNVNVNVDGNKVAEAIIPHLTRIIKDMVSSAVSSASDISHHVSPGTINP